MFPRQIEYDPRIDRSKREGAVVESVLDRGYIVDHPAEFDGGEVCAQGETGEFPNFGFFVRRFEVLDYGCSSGIWPD